MPWNWFKLFLNPADTASKNGENRMSLKTVEDFIEEERKPISRSRLDEIKNSEDV
jgi:hypothetical protein